MSIINVILYVPTLLIDLFLVCVCGFWLKWYNRIDDRVILGGLPFKRLTKQLLQTENVKAVVSMNEDFELWIANGKQEWENLGVEFLQLPTSDAFQTLNQEDLRKGVEFISKHSTSEADNAKRGTPSVYVHCRSGKTRSATMMGCYLMQKYGFTPEEAVKYIRKRRPQIILHTKQWEALRNFYKKLNSIKG